LVQPKVKFLMFNLFVGHFICNPTHLMVRITLYHHVYILHCLTVHVNHYFNTTIVTLQTP
jgi:hypothetical protein